MFDNKEHTSIEELGEFGLISHLAKSIVLTQDATIMGVGDDAAVVKPPKGRLVMTTDMLIENVHFDLIYTPLKHLGYKAVVVNLSDIAAMNARPTHILVSISISSKFTLEAVEELYSGILMACEKFKVDLVGGDTSSSPKGLVISITAIGNADKNDLVYRTGASPNDLLCVTGDLGGAYMGLQLLEREKSVYIANPQMQPDLEGFDYIIQRQLRPEPRFDVLDILKELNIKPTAMIDISDGLSSEVMHLCKQSGVGADLYEEKLPIDTVTSNLAIEFNIDPTVAALHGGEDYELLFALAPKEYEKIKNNMDITVVGHCTEYGNGIKLISRSGVSFDLKAQGWKSF
jgi:thiamine-monophosphate kinase